LTVTLDWALAGEFLGYDNHAEVRLACITAKVIAGAGVTRMFRRFIFDGKV
jgi:hypothetical protein